MDPSFASDTPIYTTTRETIASMCDITGEVTSLTQARTDAHAPRPWITAAFANAWPSTCINVASAPQTQLGARLIS